MTDCPRPVDRAEPAPVLIDEDDYFLDDGQDD